MRDGDPGSNECVCMQVIVAYDCRLEMSLLSKFSLLTRPLILQKVTPLFLSGAVLVSA